MAGVAFPTTQPTPSTKLHVLSPIHFTTCIILHLIYMYIRVRVYSVYARVAYRDKRVSGPLANRPPGCTILSIRPRLGKVRGHLHFYGW